MSFEIAWGGGGGRDHSCPLHSVLHSQKLCLSSIIHNWHLIMAPNVKLSLTVSLHWKSIHCSESLLKSLTVPLVNMQLIEEGESWGEGEREDCWQRMIIMAICSQRGTGSSIPQREKYINVEEMTSIEKHIPGLLIETQRRWYDWKRFIHIKT